MKIKKIQNGIINEIGHMYTDEQFFTYDIRRCNDLFDLIDALSHYGYDRQGALGILNNVILNQSYEANQSTQYSIPT